MLAKRKMEVERQGGREGEGKEEGRGEGGGGKLGSEIMQ